MEDLYTEDLENDIWLMEQQLIFETELRQREIVGGEVFTESEGSSGIGKFIESVGRKIKEIFKTLKDKIMDKVMEAKYNKAVKNLATDIASKKIDMKKKNKIFVADKFKKEADNYIKDVHDLLAECKSKQNDDNLSSYVKERINEINKKHKILFDSGNDKYYVFSNAIECAKILPSYRQTVSKIADEFGMKMDNELKFASTIKQTMNVAKTAGKAVDNVDRSINSIISTYYKACNIIQKALYVAGIVGTAAAAVGFKKQIDKGRSDNSTKSTDKATEEQV